MGIAQCNNKKILNVTKIESDGMLVLLNKTMEPSNVRKKSKGTTKCEKRTDTCDIRTAQCENETVKCEKKIVTCDIGTTQCEDGTVKCEKKVRESPNVIKKNCHI